MIISHKHKFIFIHCRKVAGSSVSAYLSEFLGPNDLQLGAWVDVYDGGRWPNLRVWKDLCDRRAMRHVVSKLSRRPSVIWAPRDALSVVNDAQKKKYGKKLGPNVAHPHAEDIKRAFPQEWAQYYKFCLVRNPYERVVSDYLWRVKATGIKGVSFEEFLKLLRDDCGYHPIKAHNSDNWPMYTIDDEVVADYVGRYERLGDEMRSVCGALGLTFNQQKFPHAKRTDKDYSYRDWYGVSERNFVEELFQKEISYFGYQF